MLYKIALRNIFRNKRRTLLTLAMMVFGFIFFSMFISLSDGVYGSIISKFIFERTGHVQIHKDGFLDRPSLTKNIKNYRRILKNLEKYKEIISITPRVKGVALAFGEKKHLGVQVLGIDKKLEAQMTKINERVTRGNFFINDRSVIIGKRVQKQLKLEVGSSFVLISQGADGSVANDIFEVGGTIESKEESFDDLVVYMTLDSAQEFFSLQDRIHEVAIRLEKNISREFANKLNKDMSSDLLASPWQVVEKDFYKAMQADKKGDNIGRMIFMLVVVIGVLNTILMSIIERTQEFGVLKAIGTRPLDLFKLIMIESTYLSLISIMIGSVISLGINYYLSHYGIEFEPFEYGGMRFDKMLGIINIRTFIIPSATIFLSSLIVTIFPAIKAATVTPIEAMRSW